MMGLGKFIKAILMLTHRHEVGQSLEEELLPSSSLHTDSKAIYYYWNIRFAKAIEIWHSVTSMDVAVKCYSCLEFHTIHEHLFKVKIRLKHINLTNVHFMICVVAKRTI